MVVAQRFRRVRSRKPVRDRKGRSAPVTPGPRDSARGSRKPAGRGTWARDPIAVAVDGPGGAHRLVVSSRPMEARRDGMRVGRAGHLRGSAEGRPPSPARRHRRRRARPSRRSGRDRLHRVCQDGRRRREECLRLAVRFPAAGCPPGCSIPRAQRRPCCRDRCVRALRIRAGVRCRSRGPCRRACGSSERRPGAETREPFECGAAGGPHHTISLGTAPNDPAPGMTAAASVWNHCSSSALYIAR